MGKLSYLLALAMLYLAVPARAQEESITTDADTVWTSGAGIGADLSQLFQLNPRQGAGQNRIGFGGAANFFAKYKGNRLAWDNIALLQFGVQKLGAGPLPSGANVPFQKSIDELRLSSTLGYKTSENSKFFYATNLGFLSQLLPTYLGTPDYPGNFLSDITDTDANPVAKLFSPAFITISAGIDYKPNPNFTLYYSPLGGKFVIVADDAIAVLGVHGNPVTRGPNGEVTSFQNVDSQFGSLLRASYADKFLNDRIIVTTGLQLFSNYLRNPENIDVDWNNEVAFSITEGLKLSLLVNLFYDDDVLVQITDFDAPGAVSGLGKRVSLTQQLLLTYGITF